MKRLLCCLLGIALLLSLFTGCGGGKPAPISEGGADGLLSHLIGSSNEEYLLTEDAELDLTDAHISCDRTVLLQEGVTLKLIGTFTPGEGCIAVRAGYEGGDKPILDLSGLTFELAATQEATLFEIRSDVELVAPQAQERLFVDTSGDEWTSIKSVIPKKDEPQDSEPQDDGPQADYGVSTPEEFLQVFSDSGIDRIELNNDITVAFGGAALMHDVFVVCNGHVLTLTGELNMKGGILDIGENPDIETCGTVDISGLKVTYDTGAYSADSGDIIFIGMSFKNIIGEPTLGEGILYEIPDSGEHASIKPKEVTTPEQHEAKLVEDMTQYLSGTEIEGGVGISAEFLADGVLEINLDNPVIDHEIGVMIDGGMTLILTGSVTFDGGLYGFELARDSSGTATVDITGLEIHGTEALDDTKSPDIFKITGDGVDFIFNEDDPHIEVNISDNFWLRYVQ